MEEDDDQDRFSFQLFTVSSLARLVPDYSLPLLTRHVRYFGIVLRCLTVFMNENIKHDILMLLPCSDPVVVGQIRFQAGCFSVNKLALVFNVYFVT